MTAVWRKCGELTFICERPDLWRSVDRKYGVYRVFMDIPKIERWEVYEATTDDEFADLLAIAPTLDEALAAAFLVDSAITTDCKSEPHCLPESVAARVATVAQSLLWSPAWPQDYHPNAENPRPT